MLTLALNCRLATLDHTSINLFKVVCFRHIFCHHQHFTSADGMSPLEKFWPKRTNLQTHCRQNLSKSSKGLFTWRWGTLGRWANPPSRSRKIKRVYIQSYSPGVLLGWGFLRLSLHLQSGSLSIGVPSSRLEKDERLFLGNVCIYLWKHHALCYVVLGYARNRWLIRYEE